MKIKFLGAVGCVTGSCTLLEDDTSKTRFLVDCGMTQGEPDARILNAAPWPFVPARLKFVLLTHAHLDHCGLLGRLMREGFSGPVYCTRFTAELARINLLNAARLSSDLFTEFDVRRINFVAVDEYSGFEFGRYIELTECLEAAFCLSSHIGGSCSIGIRWRANTTDSREIVFSGDLGQNTGANAPQPLLAPRQPLSMTPNYLVVESTYGSRVRDTAYGSEVARMADLERIVLDAIQRVPSDNAQGSACLVIPCFSIHRVQELLVDLHSLFEVRLKGRILAIRPAFEEPSHIEKTLQEGLRASRIESPQSILTYLSESDRERFHELFKRQEVISPDEKIKTRFVLTDLSAERKEEARKILQRAVRPSSLVRIRVFVDSPMSNRTTAVYQQELRKRDAGHPQRCLYRNPALKDHLGARDEADTDAILSKLFAGKSRRDTPAVEHEFLTYSLTFCNPEETETRIKAKTDALNIILSGSGMADVGPVTKHLERELPNPRSLVMLTGYTPGSSVAGRLRTFSKTGATGPEGVLQLPCKELPDSEIRARVEDVGPYYSGHTDQTGLLDFMFTTSGPAPQGDIATTVFVNHGDNEVRNKLRTAIMARASEKRNVERQVNAVEVPGRDHRWFDLNEDRWLPLEPESPEETRDKLLIQIYMEQRRTNDLLSELLRANRDSRRA
ncbi:MBL fold metallo-hydrolase [Zoogloea sp.]|uniref:MBL fold metallo-hydrolase n=1 Tax=Zoogloea sp. TaxID=49181 RepID=UPI001415AE24|nr:MAG: MBL fold metallo-hydrolase [Zoogloea sp.]